MAIADQDLLWQPSTTIENLRARATVLSRIRQFFADRNVLEVETPVLSHGTITDPHVNGIPAIYFDYGAIQQQEVYLQTSPEYAMKRLLAAGSGPIFQICKVFRQGETGRVHNPEFSMLEWYRPGFDHHQLMDEMDLLLQDILSVPAAERVSYAELFIRELGIDPHVADIEQLQLLAQQKQISSNLALDKDGWLDVLWTHCIEPSVAMQRPLFLFDFPASQAALAKIRPGMPSLASRFEVYFRGLELANGFHELQDAQEQANRFQHDLNMRKQMGLTKRPIDNRFLAALQQGLPDCSGVALGIDRLVMIALNTSQICDVLSFAFDRA